MKQLLRQGNGWKLYGDKEPENEPPYLLLEYDPKIIYGSAEQALIANVKFQSANRNAEVHKFNGLNGTKIIKASGLKEIKKELHSGIDLGTTESTVGSVWANGDFIGNFSNITFTN